MICYRDKTFCPYHEECIKGKKCLDALTEKVKEAAERWMKDAPIAQFASKPECFKEHKTKVVFRKYKDGEILALFPELSEGGAGVESYIHVGQHGGADYSGCIRRTVPATPEEYKDLAEELESIGYNLLIRKRR